MRPVRWVEAPNHSESLAVCLRAVLARYGYDRAYEELIAVLGLGAAVVAAREDALGWWCAYARDAALPQTAPLYGLRLRELHPPQAARRLRTSAEFPQHFRDSYVPLIETALLHDQWVLAWRGWPAPRDRLWGLITGQRGDMLIGYSLWHNGQPLPLTGAAHQTYVVEDCQPPAPGPDAPTLFGVALRRALAMWDDRWTANEDIHSGERAYQAWIAVLREPRQAPGDSLPLFRQHAQATRTLVSARRCLAEWLRATAGELPGDLVALAAHWASACDRVADRLGDFGADQAVRELLAAGRAGELCAALQDACAIEAECVASLRQVAPPDA